MTQFYLLDSNICIDFMRGRLPYGYELLKASDPSYFKIPAIVEAELRTGAEKSANPTKNRLLLERFLEPFETVPFGSRCSLAYARIRAELEGSGLKIGPNDMLIAATALAHQAILVTNNVNEFKRVPGLSLESWAEMDGFFQA